MRLDWQLIREILIAVEAHQADSGAYRPTGVDETYHLDMLISAAYVDGTSAKQAGKIKCCRAFGLTWEGNRLLADIRDDSIWQRILSRLADKGICVSVESITQAAIKIIRESI